MNINLKAKWKKYEFVRIPPITHEIDLERGYRGIAGDKIIEGIEVKYFRTAGKRRSCIEVLSKVLGLLLWDFNSVALY